MAKKQSASASDRLAQLVADRERYRQWLVGLEAERAALPDHVYTRIRDDYGAKFQAVIDELASHAETLRTMLAERETALHEADTEAAARTDALLEAEVRFRIGEFEEKQWTELRGKLEREIEEAEKQRDGLNKQVVRLTSIMEQVTKAADDAEPDSPDPDDFLRQLLDAGTEAGGTPHAGSGQTSATGRSGRTSDEAAASTSSNEKKPSAGAKPMRTVECPRCGTFNFSDIEHCDACGATLAAAS